MKPLVLGENPKASAALAKPDEKVRLRVGYQNAPFFKNACVFVLYVPASTAHRLVDLFAEVKTLLMPFKSDLAANLVCEAS